jgi:hypothetical protein
MPTETLEQSAPKFGNQVLPVMTRVVQLPTSEDAEVIEDLRTDPNAPFGLRFLSVLETETPLHFNPVEGGKYDPALQTYQMPEGVVDDTIYAGTYGKGSPEYYNCWFWSTPAAECEQYQYPAS